MAFQIRDDMLDVISTASELGKPIGSDMREGKTSFMSLFGEAECARMVEKLTQHAKKTASDAFSDSDFLCTLAEELGGRRA